MKHLHIRFHWNSDKTLRRFIGIALFSIIMFGFVLLVVHIGGLILSPKQRISSMILIIFAVLVGIVIYGFLSLKTGLAENILGSKITKITEKLHLN